MVDVLFGFIIFGNAVLGAAFFVYGLYCCRRDRDVSLSDVRREDLERAEMRSSSWPTPEEEEARR